MTPLPLPKDAPFHRAIARSAFEYNGVKNPSDDQILSASKRPFIIEEAKRQLATHRAFLKELVCTENLNPNVVVMKSAKDRV